MLIKLSTISVIACALTLATGTLMTRDAEAGGGCHEGNPITDVEGTTVRMSKNCFMPTVARVEPGALVTFVNEDAVQHTVTGAAITWGNTAEMNFEDALQAKFNDAGIYPYACILHPGMVGAIVVGDGVGQTATADVQSSRVLVAARAEAGKDPSEVDPATIAASDDDGAATILLAIGVTALVALGAGLIGGALFMRSRRSSAG